MKSVAALALVAAAFAATLSPTAAVTDVQPLDVNSCKPAQTASWLADPGKSCGTTIQYNSANVSESRTRYFYPDAVTLPKFCATTNCTLAVTKILAARPAAKEGSNVLDCYVNAITDSPTTKRYVYLYTDLIDPLAKACGIEIPPTAAPTTQPPATTTPAPTTKTPCPLPQPPEPTTARPQC